jgi:hypothetical protein
MPTAYGRTGSGTSSFGARGQRGLSAGGACKRILAHLDGVPEQRDPLLRWSLSVIGVTCLVFVTPLAAIGG